LHRLFLDANVLFSAAYRSESGLLRLWTLKDVELFTSDYALEEARVNLETPEQRQRLSELAGSLEVVSGYPELELPDEVVLPDKDKPILLAAVGVKATHLLTGDKTHFGRYFGLAVFGVLVLPPGEYLKMRIKD